MRASFALIALFSLNCALAAPFAVQVGEARIGLDAPPGFADTSFTGSPRLQELAEALTSASNRILLFAISDGDLRKFMQGDPPELRRYMVVVTPRVLEHERLDRARFDEFVRAALAEFGAPVPPGKTFAEVFDAQPAGKPVLLNELRRDPDLVSVLIGARVPAPARAQKPQYLLSSATLMRLRGKALSLAVYGVYETAADAEWIRAVTARWIDELQRLNPR